VAKSPRGLARLLGLLAEGREEERDGGDRKEKERDGGGLGPGGGIDRRQKGGEGLEG